MDQRIGIEYAVTGVDVVIAANQQLMKSLELVSGELSRLSQSTQHVNTLIRGFENLSTAGRSSTEKVTTKLGEMPGILERTEASFRSLTRSVRDYHRALTDLPSLPQRAGIPGDPGRSRPVLGGTPSAPGGRQQRPDYLSSPWSPFGMGAPKFMLRWFAMYEGLRAAKYSVEDLLLGGARKDMAHSLGELSAVSFGPMDKKKTELAANQFSTEFWTKKPEEYVGAMSQTASAFDVNKVGFENLRKMNEAAMQFGMLSKMKAEPAAEFMSKSLHGLMAFQGAGAQEALLSGQKAQVRGFGNVNLGELAERSMSQMAKAVEVTSIWGPQIATSFRYALPSMMSRGWDLAGATALPAALVNMGFHPGQTGRGLKDVFEKSPEAIARMTLMGHGEWKDVEKLRRTDPEAARYAKAENEERLKALTPVVAQQMYSDATFIPMLERLKPVYEKFLKSDKTLVGDSKFSKEFLPIIKSLFTEGFTQSYQQTVEQIRGATPEEMRSKAVGTLEDAGTAVERLTGSFHRLELALADSSLAHGIAEPMANLMNKVAASFEVERFGAKFKDKPEELKNFVESSYPGWVRSFGQDEADLLRFKTYGAAGMKHADIGGKSVDVQQGITDLFSPKWSEDPLNGLMPHEGGRDLVKDVAGFFSTSLGGLRMTEGSDPFKGLMPHEALYGMTPRPDLDFIPERFRPITGPEEMPGGSVAIAQQPPAETGSQEPIIIHNRVELDGRTIYDAIAEIFERNRRANYQGFGADPMGFNPDM